MIYHAIPNLVSTETFVLPDSPDVACSKAVAAIPATVVTKAERRAWLSKTATNHVVISAYEGLNKGLRVNPKQGNAPWKMHGLIVDYDAPALNAATTKDLIAEVLRDTPELFPQWIVTTASSQRRLIWEFASPLGLGDVTPEFLIAFTETLLRELKLEKLLAGIDKAALMNSSTYYDIGTLWEPYNTSPLPVSVAENWFAESVAKAVRKNRTGGGPPEIPMEEVFAELESRFPNTWPKGAPFHEGCRGPAIWDPNATNPTSCIFQKHGVYQFSAEKIFVSYAEIFGAAFVRKYEENRIGAAVNTVYYAGRTGYYRQFPDGAWRLVGKDDIAQYLLTVHGLSPRRPAHNQPSEIDNSLLHIQNTRTVDGGIPLVYSKDEVVRMGGGYRLLNIARITPMEPEDRPVGPEGVAWGDGFPWIAGWLMSVFEPRKQLVYLLAGMKASWEGARRCAPVRIPAVFIVGGTNIGKTFLNAKMIPAIMGGGADAKSFLVKGEAFNKQLLEVGHWHIDDSEAASNRQDHQKFTERVKGIAANPFLSYHPKYVDEQQVPLRASLGVTLNGDPESLLMIPDLDRNILDKLSVFKGVDKGTWKFKGHANSEMMLAQELPAFLRWLANWKPLKFLTTKTRFGVRTYINPDIRDIAATSSFDSDILGILEVLWSSEDSLLELRKSGEPWVGTSAELVSVMAAHAVACKLMAGMTVRGVGMRLAKLSKVKGTGVTRSQTKKGRTGNQKYVLTPTDNSTK